MSRLPIGAIRYILLIAMLCVGMYSDACPPLTAPVLFSSTFYQSPVRGEPSDLLMLPGLRFTAGDTVVYALRPDSTVALLPPSVVPSSNTSTTGVFAVVGAGNVPDSLTVQLPSIMTADRTYAIWVKSPTTGWSNGIQINDARPLWISPDAGYTTATTPGLATRYLKVVGRNLQHAPSQVTQVRLTGPATYTITAADDADAATAIEHYVAKVTLPSTMTAGTYTVAVNRDGVSWVTLTGQTFTVTANPATPTTFNPTSFGGCVANDGLDDRFCIEAAIEAASAAGGGTVVLGAGTWHLLNSTGDFGGPWGGIPLYTGVNLQGAGAGSTTVVRGATWNPDMSAQFVANFVLWGHNIVSGITFTDARTYAPSDPGQDAILFVGTLPNYLAGSGAPPVASDMTITGNVFNKPFIGLAAGGIPIDRLIVTNNEFGAYKFGMVLNGNIITAVKHRVDHAIITGNTFKPGSYLDNANVQGTIAAHLSSTRWSDVSGNTIDGTSTTYLQVPGTDAKGFRAGLFWRNLASIEMNLTSQNTLSCTGDKNGDGEAIAYDSTDNPTFPRAQFVLDATPTTVKSAGPLPTIFNGFTLPAGYFNSDYWVQVMDGPGVGQMRRITSTSTAGGGVTFTISPAWDVPPSTASRIALGNIYWQVYTVDNLVDSRTPLCLKSNQTTARAGAITLWGAPGADLAVEGNRQYDTDGIALNEAYAGEDTAFPAEIAKPKSQYFVDIRRNLVDGEYNWDDRFSRSGIWINLGATPTPESPPPVTGYGVSIARNTVIHADESIWGGGISLRLGSFDGPAPFNWKFSNNTLIYGNTLQNLNGAPPSGTSQTTRIGINLTTPLVHNTVLSGNIFTTVTTPFVDSGLGTICLTGGCL